MLVQCAQAFGTFCIIVYPEVQHSSSSTDASGLVFLQSMSYRTVFITTLITTVILSTIFFNLYPVDVFLSGRQRYTSLEKHAKTCECTQSDSCSYKWIVDGLSTGFYEAEAKHNYPVLSKSKLPKLLHKNPRYILNPDKYILPLLEGGPNNQIFCIRETIFIAVKLNRTLVIPRFFKHFTDSQSDGTSFIYPGHRLNIETVCNLVSCISLDDFQRTCGGQLDAVMTFRTKIENKTIVSHSDMTMKPTAGGFGIKVIHRLFPGIRQDKVFSKEIKKTFGSEDRCLLYQRPLFNLLIEAKNEKGRIIKKSALSAISERDRMYRTSDIMLMEDITRHTQASPYIGKLASDFLQHLVGNRSIVTVHWRYNQGDYFRRCHNILKGKNQLVRMQKLCSKVLNYTPEDAVKTFVEKLATKADYSPGPNESVNTASDVYIASPPSERLFIKQFAEILWKEKRWTVHTSEELEDYITKVYDCDVTKRHLYDLISSLEMEICARGKVFFQSTSSTWSANVRTSRLLCTREGTLPEMDSAIL